VFQTYIILAPRCVGASGEGGCLEEQLTLSRVKGAHLVTFCLVLLYLDYGFFEPLKETNLAISFLFGLSYKLEDASQRDQNKILKSKPVLGRTEFF